MNNIDRIIQLMQTDDSSDAPADAIKWSQNLFKSRALEQKPGIIERIVGILNQELKPDAAVTGERSATGGQSRQMLFQAGDNSVDLRVTKKGETFELRGQILGDGCEEASVKLGQTEIVPDEFGSFVFTNVSEGSYELLIRGEDREIVLKGIDLE